MCTEGGGHQSAARLFRDLTTATPRLSTSTAKTEKAMEHVNGNILKPGSVTSSGVKAEDHEDIENATEHVTDDNL